MPIYILQKGKQKDRDMGLNVSMNYSFQLENRDILKNTAKNILTNSGATPEATQKIVEKTLFEGDRLLKEQYTNPQLSVLKASTQISINDTLKETLKYLKSHAKKETKKTPVFGELWNIASANNQASEKKPYQNELYEYQIDKDTVNIFAA